MNLSDRNPHWAIACRQLWLAVLVQMVRDLLLNAHSAGDKLQTMQNRHEARRWIGSSDFHHVCALAGLDGTKVQARMRRHLADLDAGRFDPALLGITARGGASHHKARIAA